MTYQRNETPEPLAQEQAGEMPVVAYLVTNLSSGEPSLCFEDERGDYGDEDHMPVFEELCRRSEFTAALQAKDAEIAGLKAVLAVAVDHIEMESLRISHCKDAALIDAAIRAQTGGEQT